MRPVCSQNSPSPVFRRAFRSFAWSVPLFRILFSAAEVYFLLDQRLSYRSISPLYYIRCCINVSGNNIFSRVFFQYSTVKSDLLLLFVYHINFLIRYLIISRDFKRVSNASILCSRFSDRIYVSSEGIKRYYCVRIYYYNFTKTFPEYCPRNAFFFADIFLDHCNFLQNLLVAIYIWFLCYYVLLLPVSQKSRKTWPAPAFFHIDVFLIMVSC